MYVRKMYRVCQIYLNILSLLPLTPGSLISCEGVKDVKYKLRTAESTFQVVTLGNE